MKKTTCTIIAALSLAVFTACGNNDAGNDDYDDMNDTIMERNEGAEDYYDQDPNDPHNDGEDAIDMEDDDTM